MRPLHLTLLAALSLPVLAQLPVGALPPPDADYVSSDPSGAFRRLFLDATVVEQQEGLARVFHAAEKYDGNPVLRKDRPWEGTSDLSGPYLYGTVLWDEGKLKMWYHSWQGGAYSNLYAESRDGIAWDKPDLGLIDHGGSKANNLFLTTSEVIEEPDLYQGGGKCHNPSVIKRPWEPDPQKRYALFCYAQEYRHSRVAFSPDGLNWTFVPETAKTALFSSSDVLNFFWDPYKARYVCTWKSGSRRGRAVGVVTSPDGLIWTKPVEDPVFVADDLDPDATQVYGMPVFPYQGMYIGLPWIYNARWFKDGSYTDQRMYEAELDSPCTMDAQMAWSWDLINWTRPPAREPFIPRGKPGDFDADGIYTARGPVQVGDRLYFYYGGFLGTHNAQVWTSAIGLATMRLDGFCSMRAGQEEGRLISRRESFRVPRVSINARTGDDGYVLAEILDRNNAVIPGFSREQCRAFRGDAVRHVLTWEAGEFPEALRAAPKKIRFILRNADLYSYLPDQTIGEIVVKYVPRSVSDPLPDHASIAPEQRFSSSGHPDGFRLAEENGTIYLDLHSAAERKTSACYGQDATWTDATDWCVEGWYRVVDMGTEPNYGMATFFRPNAGRNAALYLSETAVGVNSTEGLHGHRTLRSVEMDTTDGFHWFRMVHEGGAEGTLAVFVDGREVLRMPYTELFMRTEMGGNVLFGPNAGHCEGRLHVAGFGYRVGGTEPVLGPFRGAAKD